MKFILFKFVASLIHLIYGFDFRVQYVHTIVLLMYCISSVYYKVSRNVKMMISTEMVDLILHKMTPIKIYQCKD